MGLPNQIFPNVRYFDDNIYMSSIRNKTILTPGSSSISHVIINRARKEIRVTWKNSMDLEYVYNVSVGLIDSLEATINDHESVGSWVVKNLKAPKLPVKKIPASVKYAVA